MADVNSTVQNAASGVVGVIKALIVLFVFVNIVYLLVYLYVHCSIIFKVLNILITAAGIV